MQNAKTSRSGMFLHFAFCALMEHLTLQREVEIHGVGLHSGAPVSVRLCPAERVGIVFARVDLPGRPLIFADVAHVTSTTHATTLAVAEAGVSTTEHLLAALWALGVTACRVELDGPEVPILDGSAAPWVRLVRAAGTQALAGAGPRPIYRLRDEVWVSVGDASVLGVPHPSFRLTCAVEYDVPCGARQTCDFEITPEVFADELAPARTFALDSWLEPLRAQGLIRGGSTDNAIVLSEAGPSSEFRFDNELARHKALDVIGDLALLFGGDGGILQAHVIAVRAGHGPHRRWMDECLRRAALECDA